MSDIRERALGSLPIPSPQSRMHAESRVSLAVTREDLDKITNAWASSSRFEASIAGVRVDVYVLRYAVSDVLADGRIVVEIDLQ